MGETDFLSKYQNLPQGHCNEVSVALGHVEIQGGENREMPETAPSLCGNIKGTDPFSWKRMNHLISGFQQIPIYLGENISRLPLHT